MQDQRLQQTVRPRSGSQETPAHDQTSLCARIVRVLLIIGARIHTPSTVLVLNVTPGSLVFVFAASFCIVHTAHNVSDRRASETSKVEVSACISPL